MFALTNAVRRYAWGSRTAMAEFLGRDSPSGGPEAELWIGAYPGSPSTLPDGRSLLQLIVDDPQAALGDDVVARCGPRLPFLMKVLTIGAPLSLQAHPNAAQAEAGFAAEESAGLRLDDPMRNYRDRRHKPELLCALSPVEAFCGFRTVADSIALLDGLGVAELDGLRAALSRSGLAESVRWIFELPVDDAVAAVAALRESADASPSEAYAPALHWFSHLADTYPRDRGVLLTLLCDFVRLEPGVAMFIPAGCLHGYLSGVGVEVMAESDNVLRGGLTPKHVDAVELQRILDFTEGGALVLHGDTITAGHTVFPAQVEEFRLGRYEVTEPVVLAGDRPRLLLAVDGSARLVAGDGTTLDLRRGQAAFLSVSDGAVELSGPAVVFEATIGTD